jgi:hypothetical protein
MTYVSRLAIREGTKAIAAKFQRFKEIVPGGGNRREYE